MENIKVICTIKEYLHVAPFMIWSSTIGIGRKTRELKKINRIVGSDINAYTYVHLFLIRKWEIYSGNKKIFLVNGIGLPGYLYVEEYK